LELYHYELPIYWGFQNISIKNRQIDLNKERTQLSINRARQKLYKIILSNINEKQKYKNLFLTLTFKKNITDIKEANYEYKKFIQRFYTKYGKYKYVTVIEFQKRGAVHYHTLLFNVPYIKDLHLKIKKIWKNGMTEIKPIQDIKNISAYVSKYIRKGFFDKRLSHNKAYFCSRNCTYPQIIKKDIYKHIPSDIIKLSVSSYPSNRKGQITKTLYKLI